MAQNTECHKQLRQELDSGERLLWVGQPKPGIWLRPSDGFRFAFGLVWLCFSLFWEASALAMAFQAKAKGQGDFVVWIFPLFGLPFVLIGLYWVVGQFWMDAWRRARTCYGVTDRRILILSPSLWKGRILKSLDLASLGEITLHERGDGYGTILFGSEMPWFTQYHYWWGIPFRYTVPQFENIPEARRVYNLILRLQREARHAAASSGPFPDKAFELEA
ncbi:MAG: PH domain-containing protein [Chloroflexi bacterium]|nr:PH domain-containing protein [Chloroflexota bacterium]